MFLVTWQPHAFEQMQQILTDNPDRLTELAYAIRTLSTELGRQADHWGESRDGPLRVVFPRPLSVIVHIDDNVATVVSVKLANPPEE